MIYTKIDYNAQLSREVKKLPSLFFAMFCFKNCTIKAILLTNNQASTSWGYKLVFQSAVNCWSAARTMINWRNHLLLVWFFHDELYMMKLITTLQVFNNHRFLTTFPQRPTNMLLIILRITSVCNINRNSVFEYESNKQLCHVSRWLQSRTIFNIIRWCSDLRIVLYRTVTC